jgi:hypothetical protein
MFLKGNKPHFFFSGQDQPGSCFTAQPQSHFGMGGNIIAEAGMIGTDVAQAVFTQAQNHVAQTVLIQKGAAFVLGQTEKGNTVFFFHAVSDARSHIARQMFVSGKAVVININFPADAAAVAAVALDAGKIGIIIWNQARFHAASTPIGLL